MSCLLTSLSVQATPLQPSPALPSPADPPGRLPPYLLPPAGDMACELLGASWVAEMRRRDSSGTARKTAGRRCAAGPAWTAVRACTAEARAGGRGTSAPWSVPWQAGLARPRCDAVLSGHCATPPSVPGLTPVAQAPHHPALQSSWTASTGSRRWRMRSTPRATRARTRARSTSRCGGRGAGWGAGSRAGCAAGCAPPGHPAPPMRQWPPCPS